MPPHFSRQSALLRRREVSLHRPPGGLSALRQSGPPLAASQTALPAPRHSIRQSTLRRSGALPVGPVCQSALRRYGPPSPPATCVCMCAHPTDPSGLMTTGGVAHNRETRLCRLALSQRCCREAGRLAHASARTSRAGRPVPRAEIPTGRRLSRVRPPPQERRIRWSIRPDQAGRSGPRPKALSPGMGR